MILNPIITASITIFNTISFTFQYLTHSFSILMLSIFNLTLEILFISIINALFNIYKHYLRSHSILTCIISIQHALLTCLIFLIIIISMLNISYQRYFYANNSFIEASFLFIQLFAFYFNGLLLSISNILHL